MHLNDEYFCAQKRTIFVVRSANAHHRAQILLLDKKTICNDE